MQLNIEFSTSESLNCFFHAAGVDLRLCEHDDHQHDQLFWNVRDGQIRWSRRADVLPESAKQPISADPLRLLGQSAVAPNARGGVRSAAGPIFGPRACAQLRLAVVARRDHHEAHGDPWSVLSPRAGVVQARFVSPDTGDLRGAERVELGPYYRRVFLLQDECEAPEYRAEPGDSVFGELWVPPAPGCVRARVRDVVGDHFGQG